MNDITLYAIQQLVQGKWQFAWTLYGLDVALNVVAGHFTGSKERAEAELKDAIEKGSLNPKDFRISKWIKEP